MKKVRTLLFLPFVFLCLQANAAMISLTPSSGTVFLGDSFTVDVVVSGIETDFEDELALFDVNAIFAAFFNLTNIGFGTALGGPLDSFQDVGFLGPNNAFESSFLGEFDLQTLQVNPFLILTFTFDAIGLTPGSVIDLEINPFGFLDFEGFELSVSQIDVATVQVIERPSDNDVNAPSMAAAICILIAGLMVRRKRC